jgi:PAS domain S-box-containing protein
MFAAWGEERIFVYNDAYLPILGAKHPHAFGRPMVESWGEVWSEVAPLLQRSFDGQALNFCAHPFTIVRDGIEEEAWFDFSYTPIFDDFGKVDGVLCIVSEKTGQVLAERALKRQVDSLQQLFEDAPGFMALLRGPEHLFELANGSYRDLIGGRNPTGRTIREALPEIAEQGFLDLLDEVYRTGKPFAGRRTPVSLLRGTAGGLEQRWVDFIFQPVSDNNGKINGIFVQGTDVTHHVSTELALQETAAHAASERDRLDVLLETVPTGIVIVDRHGKLHGANAAMRAIWGNRPACDSIDEYGSRTGWWADGSDRHGMRVQPDEWPIVRALHGERDIRAVIEIESSGTRSERRVLLIAAATLREADGTINGALVAQTDITEQVRAENALRDSEAKFRVIANSIPHLVWSNLPDGTHDFFNNRWHEFTGLAGAPSKDEWAAVVHPDDREQAAKRWADALATGTPYTIEYRLLHHPSREYRWCRTRAIPVHDAGGRLIRWIGTCTDVHDQRILTDELRQDGNKKDEFLAMLAHELRNPLAPIKSATELLKIGTPDRERQTKAAMVIDRQVRHMTALVDDLLDVSRVTRGLVELNLQAVDAKSVVASAVEQAKPLIEERRHALHVHVEAEHAVVLGDSIRLVQMVANLLSNAAKYTPQGGIIDVSVAVHGDNVRITVKDNGSGIEPDLLPHVFDIFTQGVRTPDRSQGGLGIGLALVKSLVALHGGSVEAHSEGAGLGSTFELGVPILRGHDSPHADLTSNLDSLTSSGGKRILVVDDNVDAAESLGQLLHMLGNDVRIGFDGAAALKIAAEFGPDAYILDVGLPDTDGYELARRLRVKGASKTALFIALTGYGQAHDRILSRAAGFHHHFVKPVDIVALCEALRAT